MKKSILFILLALCICLVAEAQVRKYSNEFLSIGVDGRAFGLGNAVVATTENATATYWNPAGLANITSDFNFSFMHAEYFAGISKLDYGALAVPMQDKKRFIGFSFLRFAVDDIPNTLELYEDDGTINYDNIKSFSIGDYAFQFSYAQKTPVKGLTLGTNFKVIYRTAGSFATAWGFGMDAGVQYRIKDVRLGLMARDITGTFNAWAFNFTDDEKATLLATGNEIPTSSLEVTVPKFTLGVAYIGSIKDKFYIIPELDMELTTDGKRNTILKSDAVSLDPRFGLELSYKQIINVRGGISNIQRSTDDFGKAITTFQPSIGAGFKIKFISLDYAFTDIGDQSETLYSHVFSLNLGITKRKKSS